MIEIIEDRFREVSGYGDLSRFPLEVSGGYSTDRDKSRDYAEVFTPPHIVDKMLLTVPGITPDTRILDLCAGQGQFTIRILRMLYQNNKNFDILKYLHKNHFFNELQLESAYKLLWIFSDRINLTIGDALQMGKLPRNWRGVWLYVGGIENWVDITRIVHWLRQKIEGRNPDIWIKKGDIFPYDKDNEKEFIEFIESLQAHLNKICEEPKMEIKRIAQTKEGRELLLRMAQDAATGIEVNWQHVHTPAWVIREMVATVPDVEKLRKILVLFNIEFLEHLIRDRKIHPSHIEFGSDSPIEGELARAVYGVKKSFSIGSSMEKMRTALDSKAGRYDVVFSNPPYQIQSIAQKTNTKNTAVAQPIYHAIVMYAIDELKPRYVCMITPSRWMAGGKGLDAYRARMLKDTHLRLIQDFPGAYDVFTSVKIDMGVSYFLWDRDYRGLCEFNGIQRAIDDFDVLVRNNTAHQIVKKVLSKSTGFCDVKVLSTKPFGLSTNYREWSDPVQGSVKCVCRNRKEKYVEFGRFTDEHGIQNNWKVCTPAAYGENTSEGKQIYNIKGTFILKPGDICTETYIIIGFFKTKKEAEMYLSYVNSRFYRFMVGLRKSSQRITKDKFSWVPDLGDYSKPWTDEELYQHFGLTKREIDHIEKTIKAI